MSLTVVVDRTVTSSLPTTSHLQAVILINKAENTVRDAAKTAGVEIYRIEEACVIQRLVNLKVTKKHTRNVSMITLAGMKSLCQRMTGDGIPRLLSEVMSVIKTSKAPPPLRYQPGYATANLPLSINDQQIPSVMEEAQDAGYRLPPVLAEIASQRSFTFPSSPPEILLLPEQCRVSYALAPVPRRVQDEIQQFMAWSQAPVNTERSAK